MALTSSSTTNIFFLLDESASMSGYTRDTRECVETIIRGNFDPKIQYTVIAFSDKTIHGKDLSRFGPPQHSGTRILPAFQQLHSLVQQKEFPERIIVVFVSDGMDSSTPGEILEDKLRKLGKLPTHSNLFTIGVGRDFPTGLVIDVLRPLYHHGDASVQSVIPVSSPDDLQWAFCQLEALMLEELTCTSNVPLEINESSSTKEIIQFVQATYNKCVIECATRGRTASQNYTLLFETKTLISEASRIAKLRLNATKATKSTESDSPTPFKPLVSNLLRETVYSPKACFTATISAITRLNTMLQDASKGKIMSELSDEAKKELLGGQYVEGKNIAVANKYRAANFGTTKNSLLRLLRAYTTNDKDQCLEDPVNLATQAEYFEDARENLQDIIPLTHTLPGILKMLSFVCRTLTLKTPIPFDALQINEWLAEVEALPQLIPRMTTFDFLERHSCNFTSRGESINSLMVLGGDKMSPGIFHHVQSFLQFKNPGLFTLTARLAVAASVLFYLLGSHDTLRPWMQNEFKIINDICSGYTHQMLESWHVYVETVTNPDFRMCLVTESPKLPPQCKCPGLTKFILALYVAATGVNSGEAYPFSIEELKARHHSTVVEFLARTKIAMSNCLCFDAQREADALLEQAWSTPMEDGDGITVGYHILKHSCTLQEAKARFSTLVEMGLSVEGLTDKAVKEAKVTVRQLKAAKYYQFTIARINAAFKNLASICGHGEEVSFTLTKAELWGALQTANLIPNGYERFAAYAPPKTPTKEEMTAFASKLAKDQLKKAIASKVDAMIEECYITNHKTHHSTLARIIPVQYMERFKEEYEYDIAKDWAVNSSGLSNIACCSPECPFYLKPLTNKTTNTICPELYNHLMMGTPAQPLPGFHKTVSIYCMGDPVRVAAKVESGECLEDPMASRECIRNLKTLTDKDKLRYWEHRKSVISAEKKTKLILNVRDLCQEINLAGKPSFPARQMEVYEVQLPALPSEVLELQLEYNDPSWKYDDFKQVFLEEYKKYPGLHRDTPHFTLQ